MQVTSACSAPGHKRRSAPLALLLGQRLEGETHGAVTQVPQPRLQWGAGYTQQSGRPWTQKQLQLGPEPPR